LRKDDGIGLWLGSRLRLKFKQKVRVYLLHQLVPEIVEELKEADHIIFIDASSSNEEWSLRRLSLGEEEFQPPLNCDFHTFYPEELAYLLKRLYGKKPEIWILSVKGENFSFGAGLSLNARRLAKEAENLLEGLIRVKLKDA